MDFGEFHDLAVEAMIEHPDWRLGQTYFNKLYEYRPDLSEQVRGGALDPFYDDRRIHVFLRWLMANWEI